MTETLQVDISSTEIRQMLDRTKAGLPRLIDDLAIELQKDLVSESGPASRRVADSWALDQMGDAESKVTSDVFFARWLAHGTKGHGPKTARRLVFAIDGQRISTTFVRGVSAYPFDERAIVAAQAKVPDILDRLVGEVGG